MIDYTLANELKDAGFRQDIYLYEETKEVGNAPTLEELIEACGEQFTSLTRREWLGDLWWARSEKEDGAKNFGGTTPTEAVARLWLALNKTGA